MKSFLDKINEIEKNKQFIPTVVKTNTNYATTASLGANQVASRLVDYLTNIVTVHTIRDFYANNPNSKLNLNDIYKISKNNFVCTPNQLNKIKDIIALGVNLEKEFEIRYNDLDVNGHANNGNYIVWALEPLSFGFKNNHRIKTLDMIYKKEAKYGEKIISQVEIKEDATTVHRLQNIEGEDLFLLECVWTKL